jgi:hypothetical protein
MPQYHAFMAAEDPAGRERKRRRDSSVTVALIGLVGTLGGAAVGAILGNHGAFVSILPGNPVKVITITPSRHEVPSGATASGGSAVSDSNGAASGPAPSSAVGVVVPVTDHGFILKWNGSAEIRSAGVRVGDSGFQSANQQDYDLLYQPGGADKGWHTNPSSQNGGQEFIWDGTGTPGPAFCNQEYLTSNYGNIPTTATIGDKLCYVDQNALVGYMEVTKVDDNGITVAAWIWTPSP